MREKGSEAARRLGVLGGQRSADQRSTFAVSPLSVGWVPATEPELPAASTAARSEAAAQADPGTWPHDDWADGVAWPLAAPPPRPDPPGNEETVRSAPRRAVPPAAAVAAVVLAVVVAAAVWMVGARSGDPVELPPRQAPEPSASHGAPAGPGALARGPEAGGPPASPAGPGATSTEVVVDVEGRVHRPGLQRLPPGSRVADAVRAAGGTTVGAVVTGLNLARMLADGEQVLVPGPGDRTPAAGGSSLPAGSTGGSSTPAGLVDLNSATEGGLDALPGVGPVLAGRIVAWRTEHGRFSSVDELAEVPGIGPKALERLRPLVRV